MCTVVFCTIRYYKDQTGLQILPGDRSRTGPYLNVNLRPKLDRTDVFILFLDSGPDSRSDLKTFWTVYEPVRKVQSVLA
jgi:hypothetical protein